MISFGTNQPIYVRNQLIEGMNRSRGAKTTQSEEYQDVLARQFKAENKAPYEHLAENGVITYNGVTFYCDTEKNQLCLGDVSNPNKCLIVSLENGGTLMVNHDRIGDLSKAITMFSPEDQKRIMYAINLYKKVKEVEQEIEEEGDKIGENLEAEAEMKDAEDEQ